jgi:hypothetical protein
VIDYLPGLFGTATSRGHKILPQTARFGVAAR